MYTSGDVIYNYGLLTAALKKLTNTRSLNPTQGLELAQLTKSGWGELVGKKIWLRKVLTQKKNP